MCTWFMGGAICWIKLISRMFVLRIKYAVYVKKERLNAIPFCVVSCLSS